MYQRNPTGLPTESVRVVDGELVSGWGFGQSRFLMRPEAVESWFILWRITKNPMYRDWGWNFFESLEKHSKVKNGYACLPNAEALNTNKEDLQPSFFLAETLKYLYLLFSPNEVLPLNQFVFNTEAHPFPIIDNPVTVV